MINALPLLLLAAVGSNAASAADTAAPVKPPPRAASLVWAQATIFRAEIVRRAPSKDSLYQTDRQHKRSQAAVIVEFY